MKIITSLLISLMVICSSSKAQYGSSGNLDVRSTGMAKTSNAASRGLYSLGINPSNLLSGIETVDFLLPLPVPNLSLKTGTNFLSINELNYFFGGVDGEGRYLNDDDKDRLRNLFKGGGSVFADASVNLFAISFKNESFGAIAFSISDYTAGKFVFPEALVNLALSGNTRGKTYTFDDEEIHSWWIRNYSISYARKLYESEQGLFSLFNKINGGISLKIVQGFFYIGTEKVETSINTSNTNAITGKADLLAFSSFSPSMGVKYDFDSSNTSKGSHPNPFMSPAGTGWGFDLGFNASIGELWNVSIAATDIGLITWKENTAEFLGSGDIFLDDLTNEAQWDTVKNKLFGESRRRGSFTTGLASALRLGASCSLLNSMLIPGDLILAFDYNQGLNSYPGNSVIPRFSVGAEWKPCNWVPYFRTGLSVGGIDGFNLAFGMGIDMNVVEINLATSDLQALIAPNSAEHISLALGSRWKF
ncbi:MAG TPA: DUF5723 family protein [Ignavibacteriaceae bacterium]|nr:DUF5723 family protein [Ignavibacteriaceae bacterium]